MSNHRISFFLVRSIACLKALQEATGLGPTEIQVIVNRDIFDRLCGVGSAPPVETVRAYFSGKRPLPYDPPRAGIPSYLMALELAFPGSSNIFFHPFFNLTLGPLRSKEKWIEKYKIYPTEWIKQHEKNGDHELVEQARSQNARLIDKRNRRKQWMPEDPLGWIHLNMLHLKDEIKNDLMARRGLVATWARNYRDIESELKHLSSFHGLDSIAAAFAIMLEAAQIGDTGRFVAARGFLLPRLSELENIEGFKTTSGDIRSLVMWHIENAFVRRYEPISSSLARYPETWKPEVYNYWTAEKFEKTIER